MAADYRERMYDRYVSGGQAPVPETLAGLSSRAAYLERFVARHFPPDRDAVVLDVGCGHGALLHFARRAGYRNLAGVDTSAEQVAAAKRLGIEGVGEGDLLESLAALPEASQDVIVAFDVIEHFTKDELLAFVDAVGRALRPGGRWILHAPNGGSPLFGTVRYGDLTHEQAFTPHSLGQLLRASGFSRVDCYEDDPAGRGWKGAARRAVWRLCRGALRLYLAAETGSTERDAVFTMNLVAVAIK